MQQRVSLITLGVADLEKSATFYGALGWQMVDTTDAMVIFDLLGQSLGLYTKEAMAEELGMASNEIGGFSGVILSHNVPEKNDVAPLLTRAKQAGGRIIKPAQDVFWGGYHGHFADLDGHIWEIAYNPFSALGPKGAFQWGGATDDND